MAGETVFQSSAEVRNGVDAESDFSLWSGLTTAQKESLTYKDWNGSSQWYMEKDQYDNWVLNSAVDNLDHFKAYQNGDDYIDAAGSGSQVRINYESGSGSGFAVYGGNSFNRLLQSHGSEFCQDSWACREQRTQLFADRQLGLGHQHRLSLRIWIDGRNSHQRRADRDGQFELFHHHEQSCHFLREPRHQADKRDRHWQPTGDFGQSGHQ